MLGSSWLLVSALLILYAQSEHRLTNERERGRLLNQAQLINANLNTQFRAMDSALNSLRDDFLSLNGNTLTRENLSSKMKAMTDALVGVRTILVLGSDGATIASNRNNIVGLNFSQRAYFQAPLHNRNPDILFITPPFKTVLGVFAVNVSKVIISETGKFAGVIAATISPEYFSTLLNSVLYARGMRASIIHGDGTIIVEEPNRGDLAGKNLARPGTHYTEHIKSGRDFSFFSSAAWTTKDKRMST